MSFSAEVSVKELSSGDYVSAQCCESGGIQVAGELQAPHFVGCSELKVHTAFRHPCMQLLQRRAFSRYLSPLLWQPAGCVGTAFWANSVMLWSSAMTHAFPAPVSCGLSFWDFDTPRAALEDAGARLWASVCKLWLPCLCPAFLWGMEFQNESWTWPWSRQVNAPCS